MKKYVLEVRGKKVTDEFCKYAAKEFENFICDDSKRTITLKLFGDTEVSVRELNTETGEYNEIPEIKQIQSDDKITLVKPGTFRRILSYFI